MKELPEVKRIFLAGNRRDRHELALAEVGERTGAPNPSDIGLAHFAFRLKNRDDLRAAYDELKKHEVPISFTVRHGVRQSIYFLDPDGYQLEVYADNPPEEIAKCAIPIISDWKSSSSRARSRACAITSGADRLCSLSGWS